MFDLFYFGSKPNLFEFEKVAVDLDDAAAQCRTGFFWFIYGGNDYSNFDFSWKPVPWETEFVHVFPSQHQRNGDVYLAHVDSVAKRAWSFRDEQSVTRLPDMTHWVFPDKPAIDDSGFDYSWHPDSLEDGYEYHFGTQWQSNGGPIYVAGRNGTKNISTQRVKALPNMDNWIVPNGIDDSEFDYSWHPSATEPDYQYQFPTQHQREGGPIYKGTAGVKYASNQQIRMGATQIFYMDFLNPESDGQFQTLREKYPDIKRTRYVSDHLNVLKRIMNMATTEFVWVISSVCDYSQFDFTWHPEAAQREMIHCVSNSRGAWNEKRGDTFYIHVESFKAQMVELELLDWFNVINYVDTLDVKRFNIPVVRYHTDNLVEVIKNHDFKTPYVLFTDNPIITEERINVVDCLWTEKDRTIRDFSASRASSLVPRDAKVYVKTQVYDYPHLFKYEHGLPFNYYYEKPLDIVYISNGEPDAEMWYNHLRTVMSQAAPTAHEIRFGNRIKRVDGVNGRVAAYQAAAEMSETSWFFAVFAKLEVNPNFNFDWQPDYWQQPKHYIFNSLNIVNGLQYGHMGMIAYNKNLVLQNNNPGIDFTLSQPHESVPLLSGTAHYDQDPWTTWRTAFREVLKLKMFMETAPTVETEHRLNVWCNYAAGKFKQYSIMGAQDAVQYYDEVNGEPAKLQLSFEWDWLRSRFNERTK
jgi:hypothetical protein